MFHAANLFVEAGQLRSERLRLRGEVQENVAFPDFGVHAVERIIGAGEARLSICGAPISYRPGRRSSRDRGSECGRRERPSGSVHMRVPRCRQTL